MRNLVMKKDLQRISFICYLTVGILCLISLLTLIFFKNINDNSYKNQLNSLVNEYKIALQDQVDSDFETLYELSNLIGNNILDYNKLNHNINNKSIFLTIDYYDKDQNVISLYNAGELEIKDVLKDSLKTLTIEESIEIYHKSSSMKESVLVYTVPVYFEDNRVQGAIIASRTTRILTDILSKPTLSNKTLDIDLIDQEGLFIARSSTNYLDDRLDLKTIYGDNFMVEAEKKLIKEYLNSDLESNFYLSIDDNRYSLRIDSIGINDWYLTTLVPLSLKVTNLSPLLCIVRGIVLIAISSSIAILVFISRKVKKSYEKIYKLSTFDQLTGAYNFDEFKKELMNCNNNYSLVSLNIKDFHSVNELLESKGANQLLFEIVEVFREVLSSNELYCRSGADQFYFIIKEFDKNKIERRLEEIKIKLKTKILNSGITHQIYFYGGVVINNRTEILSIHDLVHKVEFAQRKAKLMNHNCVLIYDEKMQEQEELETYIQTNMHRALEHHDFKLYLQPKIDVYTRKICGAEALVRWKKADGTLLFPDKFIPIFEKNRFCIQLDIYMFEKVCQKIRFWIDHGISPVNISINQSKLVFYQNNYVSILQELMKKYNVPKGLITVEVLEGILIENTEELNQIFLRLKELGIRLSLDDFGAGYSSLNIFSSLNVDEIKFDRKFLLEENPVQKDKNKNIIKSITELSNSFGIDVVAEGVELPEDEEFLRNIRCHQGQGYLYSKPIDNIAFDQMYMANLLS